MADIVMPALERAGYCKTFSPEQHGRLVIVGQVDTRRLEINRDEAPARDWFLEYLGSA